MNNDFWVTRDAICQWCPFRYFVIRENYWQIAHSWPKNRHSRQLMHYSINQRYHLLTICAARHFSTQMSISAESILTGFPRRAAAAWGHGMHVLQVATEEVLVRPLFRWSAPPVVKQPGRALLALWLATPSGSRQTTGVQSRALKYSPSTSLIASHRLPFPGETIRFIARKVGSWTNTSDSESDRSQNRTCLFMNRPFSRQEQGVERLSTN